MTKQQIKANAPDGANAYDTQDHEYFKWDGDSWKYYDPKQDAWFSAVLDPLYIGLHIKPITGLFFCYNKKNLYRV